MIFISEDLLDEVRFYLVEYLFIFILTNVAACIIYLAWRLSSRPPLGYNVHLIQTYQSQAEQRVQIINADPEQVNAEDLVSLITDENTTTESDNSNYTLRIRALVVRAPSRSAEPQNTNLSEDTTLIQLPLNTNRHISEIYQTIQHYTDQSIAGAIIVSLFRGFSRRLSNQNHLQISQLLTEVGADTNGSVSEAFTVNIPEGEETSSSEASTRSSAMSSLIDDNEPLVNAETPTDENLQATNNNSPPIINEPIETPSLNGIGEDTIKLKFLDDTEQIVKTKLSATVLEFKKAHFALHVLAGKTIRLIYRGQLLRDDNRSLESYGLQDNCVLHAHVNNKPYASATNPNSTTNNSNSTNDPSNYNANHIPPRPVFDEVLNEPWFMRTLRIGIFYADTVPFALFYALNTSFQWIRDVETVEDSPTDSSYVRQVTRVRRWLFSVLRIFVDFTEQPSVNDDMFANRFNLGVLFTLLFAVKFMSIWFVVIYFPQYTDAKGVFILLVLTVIFGLYTFQNRPRLNNQQGTNELHIQ